MSSSAGDHECATLAEIVQRSSSGQVGQKVLDRKAGKAFAQGRDDAVEDSLPLPSGAQGEFRRLEYRRRLVGLAHAQP